MRWLEYQKEAFKTNANLGDARTDDTHMFCGMITELGELVDVFKKNLAYNKPLDWKNIKEELGDFFWYVAGYAEHNQISIYYEVENFDFQTAKMGDEDSLEILLNVVADVGRLIDYRNANFQVRQMTLLNAVLGIEAFCARNNISMWRVLENNIEKLRTRYPNEFSQEKAINRNIEVESEVLDE